MRGLSLVALLLITACGPSVATSETGETGATEPGSTGDSGSDGGTSTSTSTSPTEASTDELTTTTSGETTAGDGSSTGAPALPCSCVVSDECPGELNDCAGPAPCGQVDESDPEATTCVLELMLTQQVAQFTYCNQCGGYETYEGTFHILGPGQGIDLECHRIDFSSNLLIRNHTIESPAYFEGCLALDEFAARRNCLLNGFEPVDDLPACEP